jgi:hypothetical protein
VLPLVGFLQIEIGDKFVSFENDNVEEKSAKEVGNRLVAAQG